MQLPNSVALTNSEPGAVSLRTRSVMEMESGGPSGVAFMVAGDEACTAAVAEMGTGPTTPAPDGPAAESPEGPPTPTPMPGAPSVAEPEPDRVPPSGITTSGGAAADTLARARAAFGSDVSQSDKSSASSVPAFPPPPPVRPPPLRPAACTVYSVSVEYQHDTTEDTYNVQYIKTGHKKSIVL